MYVCDRGSSHIRYADEMLREEHRRWGQEFPGIDPRVIAEEEEEYDAADIVTLPSTFACRTFVEKGVAEGKLRKIPYGVELSAFSKVSDPPKDRFEVLFVGQVSFRKGVPYLLEAFERFGHPNKRLRVVGAMQPEMQRFLSTRRYDCVEFVGAVPRVRLKHIMSASHVLVLPSIEEGLALVQGEAMACGCPVLSSTNTGAEDLFSDGREGFIVPIRDPRAIAEKLELLAQDPQLREAMRTAAMKRVSALGGWDTYGEAFGRLARECVGRRRIIGAER